MNSRATNGRIEFNGDIRVITIQGIKNEGKYGRVIDKLLD